MKVSDFAAIMLTVSAFLSFSFIMGDELEAMFEKDESFELTFAPKN